MEIKVGYNINNKDLRLFLKIEQLGVTLFIQ